MNDKEKTIASLALATLVALALGKRTQASEEGFQVHVDLKYENGDPVPTV